MQYKGYIQPKKAEPKPDFGYGVASIGILINDLQTTKKEVETSLDTKVKEVDTHIGKAETILDKKIKEVDQTIAKAESDAVQMIKDIQNIPQLKGHDAEPAKEIDQEKLIKDILSKLPKPKEFDEKVLIQKVITAIPKNKASLKIIQEKFETDPMSIIDKIMSMPDGKFKLKSSQIDGLDQTIRAFQSQLGRGYLHGGGDSVVAGTNVTITTNTNGKKTINAFENTGVWLNDNLTTNARLTVSAVAPANPAINDLWFDIS